MIKLHTNGYHGLIRTDGVTCARQKSGERSSVSFTAGADASAGGGSVRPAQVERFSGSNRIDGDRLEPLFGSGEWKPDVEDQDQMFCDRCGGDDGVIQRVKACIVRHAIEPASNGG